MLAFSNVTDLKTFQTTFAGLDNFVRALTNDMEFLPALYTSILDLINVPIVILYSLFIAILLNKKFKGRGLYRLLFILPLLIGTGVISEALSGNSAQIGMSLGAASDAAGNASVSFQDLRLNNQLTALLGTQLSGYVGAIVNRVSDVMWTSSIQIILFLGTLQTIPDALYEAAVIDGASEFEQLLKITLPMSLPTIEIGMIYTVIDYFTSSDNKLMIYISNISFDSLMLSYGSAMAWMYFLVVGVILLIVVGLLKLLGRRYE